jgi:tetratricopeptide (TPR) repeat protein
VNLGTLLKMQFSDFAGARRHFELALESDPRNKFGHFNLAMLLLKQLKDPAASIGHFQSVLSLDPSFTKAELALKEGLLRSFVTLGYPDNIQRRRHSVSPSTRHLRQPTI